MQKAACHSIPRGFRPTYTPCLDEKCQDLLKQYEKSGDPDTAEHLIESLDAARQHRWEELTSKMNFTHSSRKSWALIRRLGAAQQPPKTTHPSVSANAVAAHLIQVAKAPQEGRILGYCFREFWHQLTGQSCPDERLLKRLLLWLSGHMTNFLKLVFSLYRIKNMHKPCIPCRC